MNDLIPETESRGRFIAKVATVYFVYAVICVSLVWYILRHNPPLWLTTVGLALDCVVGVGLWIWTMRRWTTRYRLQHRAFYSKLLTEFLPVGATDAVAAQHPDDQAVAVSVGTYTVLQVIALTLMDMYLKPVNAFGFLIFSLIILFAFLYNWWPPSFPRLVLAIAAAAAFNVLMVANVTIGMRRKLKKLWKGEAVFRLSNRGLEISQGAQPGSILPWASIDQVHETLSWILFMRAGRRIVAIPTSRVPYQSLGRLREIVRTAKGQVAEPKIRP